jgi:hypothetical protein
MRLPVQQSKTVKMISDEGGIWPTAPDDSLQDDLSRDREKSGPGE